MLENGNQVGRGQFLFEKFVTLKMNVMYLPSNSAVALFDGKYMTFNIMAISINSNGNSLHVSSKYLQNQKIVKIFTWKMKVKIKKGFVPFD